MGYLEDLASYIDTSTTLTAGSSLFLVSMPFETDHCACIYEYDGVGLMENFRGGTEPLDTRLQVQVRDVDYSVARNRAKEIRDLLHAVVDTTLGSTHFYRIAAKGSITLLEVDENQRSRVKQDFSVIVTG